MTSATPARRASCAPTRRLIVTAGLLAMVATLCLAGCSKPVGALVVVGDGDSTSVCPGDSGLPRVIGNNWLVNTSKTDPVTLNWIKLGDPHGVHLAAAYAIVADTISPYGGGFEVPPRKETAPRFFDLLQASWEQSVDLDGAIVPPGSGFTPIVGVRPDDIETGGIVEWYTVGYTYRGYHFESEPVHSGIELRPTPKDGECTYDDEEDYDDDGYGDDYPFDADYEEYDYDADHDDWLPL